MIRFHEPALAGLCLAASMAFASSAFAAPACGPGAHWVDTCPSGTDSFGSSATIGIDLNFDSVVDMSLVLSGPTTIFRGSPVVGGGPHTAEIPIEIVSLTLTGSGFTVRAGDGVGNNSNDGALYSPGMISEQSGDPALADSFFDVFFELELPNLTILRNQNPLRIEAVIDRVPPLGIPYVHNIQTPVPLFDQQGNIVALLVNAVHTPTIPEPGLLGLFGLGLLGLALARRR